MENRNNKKKLWIGILATVLLVAAVAVFAIVYKNAQQPARQGEKNVTVAIVDADGNKEEKQLKTDAEYLGEALQDAKLVEGELSEYGLFIKSVNGIAADDALQQWWCITKGGADVLTGADTTPIADGDTFELTLKTGW